MTGLDPDVRSALDNLLSGDWSEDTLINDLARAARESLHRRAANSRDGGAVLVELHRQVQSWRRVEELTGIPRTTAQRWAEPPPCVRGDERPPG